MVTLEASVLFNQLRPDQLEALRPAVREQTFAPAQEIFKEGDVGDGLYVVRSGRVEITGLVQNVRRVFSQAGPGDMFGEMAVIEDQPRSACASAREETRVYFVARQEVLKCIETSPAFARALLREVSRRLREFNRQYLHEALQTERLALLGRFARSIVHDLKNPLGIIGITAELLGMENATPAARHEACVRIRAQVDRISELINEIFDFTHGSSSSVILAPVTYSRFMERLLEELRPEMALKSVALELENDPPEIPVLLDPKRLRRVFHNLAHNASDAMREGGRILMRFTQRPGEIVTEIEDDGPGIAPEIADQLFEAFATHGKAHGTGLGLSISKRILEDHQGWIAARNRPGGGAIFSFGLPLSK